MATKDKRRHKFELRKTDTAFDPKHGHENALKLIENGNYDKAIDAYTKIIAHDPKQKKAYYYRAVAEAKTGNHEKAIADLDKALDLDDGYVEANVYSGILHCISEDHKDSMY